MIESLDLHNEVKALHLVCGDDVMNPQSEIVHDAWRDILKINYWPIFAVARDIINQMHPKQIAEGYCGYSVDTAHTMSQRPDVGVSHDLTGRMSSKA